MLSAPQLRLYRAEWAKARRQLRKLGYPPADADAVRYQIHADCGAPQSSTDPAWRNSHLDTVLAHFFAWSNPGSLGAQERQQNQPGIRSLWVCERLIEMANDFLPPGDLPPARHYVFAVFKRLHPDYTSDPLKATSLQWSPVLAALAKHYDRKACQALCKAPHHRIQFPPHAHARTLERVRFYQQVQDRKRALELAGTPVDSDPF